MIDLSTLISTSSQEYLRTNKTRILFPFLWVQGLQCIKTMQYDSSKCLKSTFHMSVFLSHVLSIKRKGFPCHFFLPAHLWIFFFYYFSIFFFSFCFFFFFSQKEDYVCMFAKRQCTKALYIYSINTWSFNFQEIFSLVYAVGWCLIESSGSRSPSHTPSSLQGACLSKRGEKKAEHTYAALSPERIQGPPSDWKKRTIKSIMKYSAT